jgi:hypothetical protein
MNPEPRRSEDDAVLPQAHKPFEAMLAAAVRLAGMLRKVRKAAEQLGGILVGDTDVGFVLETAKGLLQDEPNKLLTHLARRLAAPTN